MKKLIVLDLSLSVLAMASLIHAQQEQAQEQLPARAKQEGHAWLKQLVGQWDGEAELTMAPGEPAIKVKSHESSKMLGEHWLIGDYQTTIGETKITAIMTLGYDAESKKYIGTWVDSMSSHLWQLEGTVDETGTKLTILAKGPNPAAPDGTSMFRDVIEVKGQGQKVMTSSMQSADGTWQTFSVGSYQRR